MIKTNSFIKNLLEKGMVDDVAFIENGYDIQLGNKLVSVRLNNKGGAVIWNHKTEPVEISSGRLDDVLHRYIVCSVFGTQNAHGIHGIECKDTFLVPSKIINNAVIFTDSLDRKYVVSNTTPEAILSYFKEACSVNADDCMVMLNGFTPYTPEARRALKSSVETNEVELQLLKCSVSIDDYAVYAKSELVNNVGQTIVGNFLCSSADKLNMMTFEEDIANVFVGNSCTKRNIKSSTVRSKNPFAVRTQTALKSLASRKAVNDYLNAKYPNGLSIKAVESALAYEAPSLFKAANIHDKLSYENVFAHYAKKADNIMFRLDSNKSILASVEKTGESVCKFRAIPNVEGIRNALHREGYTLDELESGIRLEAISELTGSIVNSCQNFVPVTEAVINKPNLVVKQCGKACTSALNSYGIDDTEYVFKTLVKVINN